MNGSNQCSGQGVLVAVAVVHLECHDGAVGENGEDYKVVKWLPIDYPLTQHTKAICLREYEQRCRALMQVHNQAPIALTCPGRNFFFFRGASAAACFIA